MCICKCSQLILNISLRKLIQYKQIKLPNLSLCFIRDVYLLLILHVLEEFINLRKEMEGMKEDMRDKRESAKDKKIVKEGVAEKLFKRNGEFYFIGFCFALNVLVNSECLDK